MRTQRSVLINSAFALIPVGVYYYALIDIDDVTRVSAYTWSVLKGKTGNVRYAYTRKGKSIYMHRMLVQCGPGQEVDHINGNGLDNRKANLRTCTHRENTQNQRARSGDKKGYYFDRSRSKWAAEIKIDGKKKYLGRFQNEIDARRAYDMAAVRHFGEFARVNENL